MRLYVMRHGVAIDRHDPGAPSDPTRPLTADGKERARLAAHGLVSLGLAIDRIWTSPYLRATETADIVAESLGVPRLAIEQRAELIPENDPAATVAALRSTNLRGLMLIGHAPHLDELISHLLGCAHSLTALKKAGVAVLDLRSPADRARLIALYEPKVLRQLGRQ